MADGSASPASHALRREIDALETLCEAMADWLDQTGFDLDRRQLVELRRRLTNQIIEIGRIGELHFAASPADANGFRVRLSALRAWTAAHQAAWPAVRIEPHSAALVSSLVGVGTELAAGNDGDLVRALRSGLQDSTNEAGRRVVERELSVPPTLTIRPGFAFRVIVTRDLILEDQGWGGAK